jgi:hypothetical protein
MDASHIADQLLTASTALAGLVLVFLSNVISGFDSYDPREKASVRPRFRFRARFGLAGFGAALLSALASLVYYWICWGWLVDASAGLLVLSLFIALAAAFISTKDIG